jgi:peptide/nickel transport system ATP-binding protein
MLEVRDLVRSYPLPRAHPFARVGSRTVLHGVSLHIAAGEALGLVGESGSGKSTLARTVLGLEAPQGGVVRVDGHDPRASRRGGIGAVFQDPYGSLDPRMRVGASVAEPLLGLAPRAERRRRVDEMLEAVGLPAAAAARYPHEFSGGQRQRIALARALVTLPALVVADEPVSSLDVSVQAQVLALIAELRARYGSAWLFISHDLAVVRLVTDRVAVLLEGRIVEEGLSAQVFSAPQHPYTQALVAAIPRPPGHA